MVTNCLLFPCPYYSKRSGPVKRKFAGTDNHPVVRLYRYDHITEPTVLLNDYEQSMAGTSSVEGMNNPFGAVAADAWYTDAVLRAYNTEISKGLNNTTFVPGANITRARIVSSSCGTAWAQVGTDTQWDQGRPKAGRLPRLPVSRPPHNLICQP